MDELTKLAAVYASKFHLSDDECIFYKTIMSYLDTHYRLALMVLKEQAKEEGLTDEESRDYSETNSWSTE